MEERRKKRHRRIRKKIVGTKDKPRLCVYRSNKHIYAQLIDDIAHHTLVAADSTKIEKGTKTEKSKECGKLLAKKALENKIKTCVFDRSGYKYHGRVKALAEGAREGGLKF